VAKTLRCYLGKHEWRLRKGRIHEWDDEERTFYWCVTCGKTRDNAPRRGGGGASAPIPPGGGAAPY
jgi:hypothetical protein